MTTETRRFCVYIDPFQDGLGGYSVWINGADEDFATEAGAYLGALDSAYCFTRWGARRWARRRCKQLVHREKRAQESFEFEVSR